MAKYDALREHLASLEGDTVELAFGDIAAMVGGLPQAAGRRDWWVNQVGLRHAHASAWLDAGWRVDWVNQVGGSVRFRRSEDAAAQAPP